MSEHDEPGEILDFWFGAPDDEALGQERSEWWEPSAAFDARVIDRFAATHRRALAGQLEAWRADARGALAYVLVLDQLSRHIHRGTAAAYAGDARALEAAQEAVTRAWDRLLPAFQRQFLYMPFMHSEALADQERSVELFDQLADEAPRVDQRRWAHAYLATIREHGRFPHRDAALGRRR
ncbi:MAG: DUF924 family protein [Kofleriaceae bacterium]